MENLELHWLLTAYLNPTARLGVVADRIMAEATLSTLRERAAHFAWRLGFIDPEIGDEALASMLSWAANSTVAERFKSARGTPRHYIDKILRNFVALEIRKRYRRPVRPLPEGLPSRNIDPAKLAEIDELTNLCEKLIADDNEDDDNATGTPVQSSPDKPKTPRTDPKATRPAIYVQKHRERKRLWARIEAHFPEMEMRPGAWRRRRSQKQLMSPEQATRRTTPTSVPFVCSGLNQD